MFDISYNGTLTLLPLWSQLVETGEAMLLLPTVKYFYIQCDTNICYKELCLLESKQSLTVLSIYLIDALPPKSLKAVILSPPHPPI